MYMTVSEQPPNRKTNHSGWLIWLGVGITLLIHGTIALILFVHKPKVTAKKALIQSFARKDLPKVPVMGPMIPGSKGGGGRGGNGKQAGSGASMPKAPSLSKDELAKTIANSNAIGRLKAGLAQISQAGKSTAEDAFGGLGGTGPSVSGNPGISPQGGDETGGIKHGDDLSLSGPSKGLNTGDKSEKEVFVPTVDGLVSRKAPPPPPPEKRDPKNDKENNDIFVATFRAYKTGVQLCQSQEQDPTKEPISRLHLKIFINSQKKVEDLTTREDLDPKIEDCIMNLSKKWTFPKLRVPEGKVESFDVLVYPR